MGFDSDSDDESSWRAQTPIGSANSGLNTAQPSFSGGGDVCLASADRLAPEGTTANGGVELIEVAESHAGSPSEEPHDEICGVPTASASATPLFAIPTPFGRRHDQPTGMLAAAAPIGDVRHGGELPPLPDIARYEIVPHNWIRPQDRDLSYTFDAEGKVPLWDHESIHFWMCWFDKYVCAQRLARGGSQLEPMTCISACTGSYSPGAVAWVTTGPPKRQANLYKSRQHFKTSKLS